MSIIFRLVMSEMRSFITLFFILLLVSGCVREGQKEVVVYTSVDQVFSEPILKDFEKKTGKRKIMGSALDMGHFKRSA